MALVGQYQLLLAAPESGRTRSVTVSCIRETLYLKLAIFSSIDTMLRSIMLLRYV